MTEIKPKPKDASASAGASSSAPATADRSADKPIAATPAAAVPAGKKVAKKRVRKVVSQAHAYIMASYNNTIISITEPNGELIAAASSGSVGFKGSRKATPYAAQVTAEKVVEKLAPYGVKSLKVFIKGVGTGREQAVRGLQAAGLDLDAIFDITAMPHNGCRRKKARRV
ncbi:30S ribosomal protein S11 [Candidatus Peregrinibacteria bacterium]|nr:30S ribosomal protein S11 [Candidatus Peregrinibacteria bacterium]